MPKIKKRMAKSALGSGVERSLPTKKKKTNPRRATVVQTTAAAGDPKMAKGSKDGVDPKSPKNRPLKVGEHYMVRRDNESLHPAEILHKRYNNQENHFEYFIHYDGYDKRLDEWVPIERIINPNLDVSAKTLNQKNSNKTTVVLDQLDSTFTRNQKQKYDQISHVPMSHLDTDQATVTLEKEHEAINKIKYINKIQLGKYEISTWYFSQFPKEYQNESKIWICEYCLKYCKLEKTFSYHMSQCVRRQPPGIEVYHKESLSIWEVDSSQHKLYCQNLCLLAKLFLDHKSVLFDSEQFLFYVLCKVEKDGAHLIGYFSKEKDSFDGYNVACILIMPPFQRQGFGKLLIGFSYELSKLERLIASPEKPLSDFGKCSYLSYWSWVLLEIFKTNTKGSFSIEEISNMTSMTKTDIISTLQSMNMVKYWKGQHIVCVKPSYIKKLLNSNYYKKPRFIIDRSCVKWTPRKYNNSQPGPSWQSS